jgi:RNA-dependent RNA polymerase
VTQHYAEYINDFLRVPFVDENLGRLHSNDLSLRMNNRGPKWTKLYKRILQILRDCIVTGDKWFEFLAFSSSQLRESAVWMFVSNGID